MTPRRAIRRPGEWWQSYFDAHYLLEYEPMFSPARDRAEVARLLEILGLPVGARVLDVPCGQGRHSHLLAEAGLTVTGFDYSPYLLARARERGTGRALRYVRGDMRRLSRAWTGRFDAVVNLFTSFGFFLDPNDDARVIHEFARVLQPDGILVWHGGSRDGVMAQFLDRDWWQAADGTVIAHDRSFDPLSGVLSITSTWRGTRNDGGRAHRIRLYTASRLANLCANAGLIVEEAWDGWTREPLTRTAAEMLLVARKRGLARRQPRG